MTKEKKQKHFIHKPVYPGGQKAMTDFIYQHLKYPEAAVSANVEGTVLVDYDIDHKGKVIATRVLQSLGFGCDEEACRVVAMLKFEVEKNRGVHVIFHQKAKILFKKPKQMPAPAPVQTTFNISVQYAVVNEPSAPTQQETREKPVQTFTYTIKI